jgi:hypothetical protein
MCRLNLIFSKIFLRLVVLFEKNALLMSRS